MKKRLMVNNQENEKLESSLTRRIGRTSEELYI